MSRPPDCPVCHGQTEWSGGGGIVCFFCGYEQLPRPHATPLAPPTITSIERNR